MQLDRYKPLGLHGDRKWTCDPQTGARTKANLLVWVQSTSLAPQGARRPWSGHFFPNIQNVAQNWSPRALECTLRCSWARCITWASRLVERLTDQGVRDLASAHLGPKTESGPRTWEEGQSGLARRVIPSLICPYELYAIVRPAWACPGSHGLVNGSAWSHGGPPDLPCSQLSSLWAVDVMF
jgi:hypothetical protein